MTEGSKTSVVTEVSLVDKDDRTGFRILAHGALNQMVQ